MSNITLDNGIFKTGAFQLKGIQSTLKKIDTDGNGTITREEFFAANFSTTDAKTQALKTALTDIFIAGPPAGFQITPANIKSLESKMEDAWKADHAKKTLAASQASQTEAPTTKIANTENNAVKAKNTETTKPEKSSNFLSRFFSVKNKSTDDVKVEGFKSMLLFGAIGILAGPVGIVVGISIGVALTAGKLMAKEIKYPESIKRPTISFRGPELNEAYKSAKALDKMNGNHFHETYIPKTDVLDILKQ
ncbi:MAG: EF-hand domain-containing protein [Candidatus Margulisbacteria bacterium]|nr:EF-hand domain-containing protein [Candidatus Margulisiibacteriota bacterium]